MKNISYESIKKIIKKEQEGHICICIDVVDKDMQQWVLKSILPESVVSIKENYDSFTRIEFVDFQVIEYKKHSDNNIEEKIIILNPNKNNSLLEVSRKSNVMFGNGIICEEYKLSNSKHDLTYFIKKSDKYMNNELVESGITLMEKSISTGRYLIKNYNFIYRDNQCVILEIDGESFVANNQLYINRLEMATSHIQKLETIFESNMKSSFGLEEETKVYKIKRK